MSLRLSLLVTALVAGSLTAATAQDPNPEPRPGRRTWSWVEPNFRRPALDFYRFRMTPDRRLMVERALERAERTRTVALDRARSQVERAARLRDRARDRSLNRLRENRLQDRAARERATERVRERLDRLRDDHRYLIRRRVRTI